jgi:predicted CxxxxCH...CXXCH cytochrome family protein
MPSIDALVARVLDLFPAAWDCHTNKDAWGGDHAAALHEALVDLPATAVPALDQALRRRSWGGVGDLGKGDLCLAASCHSSGYTREQAVREMSRWTDGREIPFLLVRLNDWVPAIRDAALAALQARLSPAHLATWIAAFPLVVALRAQSRADHAGLVAAVDDLLLGDDPESLWRLAASQTDRTTRRALSWAASRNRRSVIPRDLPLLTDPDVVIAVRAAHSLARRAEGDPSILGALWSSPNPRVRRLAFEGLFRAVSDPDFFLREVAFDADGDLRETARYELKKRGVDARALYREAARDPVSRGQIAVLRALADVAEASDAPAFEPLLRHPRARLRAFAVTVLGRWTPLSLVGALDDPSQRVVRAALAVLLPEARLLDAEVLWKLIATAPSAGAIGALRIAAHLRPWQAIEMVARAAALPRPELTAPASDAFTRLAQVGFRLAPTAAEESALRASLDAARPRLAPFWVDRIEDDLRALARR